jgi:protein required for attachment to host cells
MSMFTIPHDAIVFIGDGQKALFLRNLGDEEFPNLKTEQVFKEKDSPAHEQGTDRPGRAFKRAGTNLRSSVETTDWHELEKEQFALRVAAALEQFVRANHTRKIVIVAPPRTLAELRRVFHADIRHRIVAEVNKDLTKEPIWEIERHLFAQN